MVLDVRFVVVDHPNIYLQFQFVPESVQYSKEIIYAEYNFVHFNTSVLQYGAAKARSWPIEMFVHERMPSSTNPVYAPSGPPEITDLGTTNTEKIIAWFEWLTSPDLISVGRGGGRFGFTPIPVFFVWGRINERVVLKRLQVKREQFNGKGEALQARITVEAVQFSNWPLE